jgi:hypothetical protein
MKTMVKHLIIKVFLFSIIVSCSNYEKMNLYPVTNEEGKYGFIDQSGKLMIEFKFDYAHRFYNNRALVLISDKAYYINKKGKLLFRAILEPKKKLKSRDLSEGFEDVPLTKASFKSVSSVYFFSENLAAFFDTTKNAFGYIDIDGNVVIPGKFSVVNSFNEGLAAVKMADTSKIESNKFSIEFDDFNSKFKYGYINKSGNFEIEPIFNSATDFSNGKAFVNIQAEDLSTEEGYALSMDGYVINKKGNTLSSNISNTKAWKNSDGYFPAWNFMMNLLTGRGYYYIDSSFRHFPTSDGEKLYFKDLTRFSDGIAGVRIDDYWIVIDTKMNIVADEKFSDVKVSSEGLIPVKRDMKWSYMSVNGTSPFTFSFDSCTSFFNGLAYVETYDLNSTIKGYINKDGKYVWQKLIPNKKIKQ